MIRLPSRSVAYGAALILLVACAGSSSSNPALNPAGTITPQGPPAWSASQHTGYLAVLDFDLTGFVGPRILIFAPRQAVPSAVISESAVTIAFDSKGNLYADREIDQSSSTVPFEVAIDEISPGMGVPRTLAILPSNGLGPNFAVGLQGTIAISSPAMAPVYVFASGSNSVSYQLATTVFGGEVAVGPNGEIAAGSGLQTVCTYPPSSSAADRCINGAGYPGYDGLGNLAMSGGAGTAIYAPHSTTPSYSVPSVGYVSFDATNRLLIDSANTVTLYPSGSTTAVNTIAQSNAGAAIDNVGDIAIVPAGASGTLGTVVVYHPDGTSTTLTGFNNPGVLAFSP